MQAPSPLLSVTWTFIAFLAPAAEAQTWNEAANLTASNGGSQNRFGTAVAVSGTTAVVVARWGHGLVPSSGTAYVYERSHGGTSAWGEIALLVASDGKALDEFGSAVAIDGDTIVVGARYHDHPGTPNSGSAYVFERNQGGPDAWGLVRELTTLDGTQNDLGDSVAVSGEWIALGAPTAQVGILGTGAAYLFRRNKGGANQWGEVAKVHATAPEALDRFGGSIDLDGELLIVGAPDDSVSNVKTGSAWVFRKDLGGQNKWGLESLLVPSNGSAGDQFGEALSISGETAVVGSSGKQTAYVFERNSGGGAQWSEVAKLNGSSLRGAYLALDADTIVVGDANADAFMVFERDLGGPGAWGKLATVSSLITEDGDLFGHSVGLCGPTVIVGSTYDMPFGPQSGSAYVFEASYLTQAYCTAGTSSVGCRALLSTSGLPSATASSGFTLMASTVEGAKDGVFFYGTNGRKASPWGTSSSYHCVVGPAKRGGLLLGTGTPGACDGSFAQDLNARWCPTCPKPNHNSGVGATVNAQLWYRNPLSTSNKQTAFSDAVEFVIGP